MKDPVSYLYEMEKDTDSCLIRFFEIVTKLKAVKRKGWIDKLGIMDPESVADHSFAMATMAMIFSNVVGLNTEKVVKMALLHDLAESEIGDITPDSSGWEQKNEIEKKSMKTILQHLHPEIALEYQNLWDEYIERQTNEAIFVHEIDKLEMVLQSYVYSKKGFTKSNMMPFIKTAQKEIKTEELKSVLAKLLQGF